MLPLFPNKHFPQRQTKVSYRQPLKKHHYVAASVLILVCSWVTHSTTASVSVNYDVQTLNSLPFDVSSFDDNNQSLSLLTPLSIASEPHNTTFDDIDNQANHTSNISLEVEGRNNQPTAESFSLLNHTVKRGDTLGKIFQNLDLDVALPYKISQDSNSKQLVTGLAVGRDITFKLGAQDQLREITYPVNKRQELIVQIDDGEIKNSQVVDLPYEKVEQHVSGEIHSSLYEAAIDAGLSINLVMEMVRIFGWDIDFVLDIRKGDSFHVIYDIYQQNGEFLDDGNILAAEFTTQGTTYRAFRHTDASGDASYYNANGDSMLGTFLRSPVEFSRISSRFGKRKHPILKTWRAHNGVDYAAATGTPIRATADGKVTHKGTKGGYGRTVILRHAGRFSTLYAHMNGYARGLHSGKTVKQGEVIGYIGSSGLATGPHLHYEFRVDGVHRNPLTYKTPKATSIAAVDKAAFDLVTANWQTELKQISQQYLALKQNSNKATL